MRFRRRLDVFKLRGRLCRFSLILAVVAGLWWLDDILSWWAPASEETFFDSFQDKIISEFYRRNRYLKYFLDNIQLLIEPLLTPCEGAHHVNLIVLVTSAPSHLERRSAIRDTWGTHLPTYFALGLENSGDDNFGNTYMEAKQHGDMLVFDFEDHYQNLTLKTALMLQWSLKRCPQAEFVFKTDDDVLVNPWTFKRVLEENEDAQLLGYRSTDHEIHREETSRWYVPRWLFAQDIVPEFLSGCGYVISGDILKKILKAAQTVPLINLEDIYFTYIIASKTLGLKLTNDRRVSAFKPLIPTGCAYWRLGSVHKLGPKEIRDAWDKTKSINIKYKQDKSVCDFYEYLEYILYYLDFRE